MTLEEILNAYGTEETLEYHVTGGEIDPDHVLPEHGWYPCLINYVEDNGNVEISLVSPETEEIEITVLQKNIPIAFRKERKTHE